MTKGERQIIDIAKRVLARDGELEIDNDALVSASQDGGSYIQAWVWISNETLEANGYNAEGENEMESTRDDGQIRD